HLVDHARAYIEKTYRRPLPDRILRRLLAAILPVPGRFRAALALARLARPLAPLLARYAASKPLAAMLALAPRAMPRRRELADATPSRGTRGRVALLRGCVEPVLRPEIREAAVRVLER